MRIEVKHAKPEGTSWAYVVLPKAEENGGLVFALEDGERKALERALGGVIEESPKGVGIVLQVKEEGEEVAVEKIEGASLGLALGLGLRLAQEIRRAG